MAKLVVPNAALVTLRWNQGTTVFYNVLGAFAPGTTTINQALANTLSSAVMSAFTGGTLISQLHTTTALGKVSIRDIRNPDLPDLVGSATGAVGTGTGDPLPLGNSICVTLRTAGAGASKRGRVYIGGLTETANDTTGKIGAAANTAAVAFITAIGSAMTSNGLSLAVVSRPAERVQTVVTTYHADGTTDVKTSTSSARTGGVTTVSLVEARNTNWDTQRRRSATGSGSTLFVMSDWRSELAVPA